MAALTKNDLRDYVLAGQRNVGSGYVLLDMKHNLTSVRFFSNTRLFHYSSFAPVCTVPRRIPTPSLEIGNILRPEVVCPAAAPSYSQRF